MYFDIAVTFIVNAKKRSSDKILSSILRFRTWITYNFMQSSDKGKSSFQWDIAL